MADYNWEAVRNEYIAGGISQRNLAAKWGIPYRTLVDRAVAEKWTELREKVRSESIAKTVDAISTQNAQVDDRINKLALRLIEKLEKAVGELDMKTVTVKNTLKVGPSKVTTEYRKLEPEIIGPVDRSGMQSLTGVLRDLKEILDVRSDMDRQEQLARIEKLRRDVQAEDTSTEVTVRLEGELSEYV